MPKKVCYYEPTDLGHEAKIKERLKKMRQASPALGKKACGEIPDLPSGKDKSK
jgi:hypothetical protein